jgi:Pyridoxamine 5'-phosphate oxidase
MWTVMDAAARAEFLTGVHVGVLGAALGAPGRTLAVPVWYDYRPGGLVTVLTGRGSRKAQAIRAAGRFSLCAQDEYPPYRYVSVEGPVVSQEGPSAAERLALARRYLGTAGGDTYVADNPDPGQEIMAFRMRPARPANPPPIAPYRRLGAPEDKGGCGYEGAQTRRFGGCS